MAARPNHFLQRTAEDAQPNLDEARRARPQLHTMSRKEKDLAPPSVQSTATAGARRDDGSLNGRTQRHWGPDRPRNIYSNSESTSKYGSETTSRDESHVLSTPSQITASQSGLNSDERRIFGQQAQTAARRDEEYQLTSPELHRIQIPLRLPASRTLSASETDVRRSLGTRTPVMGTFELDARSAHHEGPSRVNPQFRVQPAPRDSSSDNAVAGPSKPTYYDDRRRMPPVAIEPQSSPQRRPEASGPRSAPLFRTPSSDDEKPVVEPPQTAVRDARQVTDPRKAGNSGANEAHASSASQTSARKRPATSLDLSSSSEDEMQIPAGPRSSRPTPTSTAKSAPRYPASEITAAQTVIAVGPAASSSTGSLPNGSRQLATQTLAISRTHNSDIASSSSSASTIPGDYLPSNDSPLRFWDRHTTPSNLMAGRDLKRLPIPEQVAKDRTEHIHSRVIAAELALLQPVKVIGRTFGAGTLSILFEKLPLASNEQAIALPTALQSSSDEHQVPSDLREPFFFRQIGIAAMSGNVTKGKYYTAALLVLQYEEDVKKDSATSKHPVPMANDKSSPLVPAPVPDVAVAQTTSSTMPVQASSSNMDVEIDIKPNVRSFGTTNPPSSTSVSLPSTQLPRPTSAAPAHRPKLEAQSPSALPMRDPTTIKETVASSDVPTLASSSNARLGFPKNICPSFTDIAHTQHHIHLYLKRYFETFESRRGSIPSFYHAQATLSILDLTRPTDGVVRVSSNDIAVTPYVIMNRFRSMPACTIPFSDDLKFIWDAYRITADTNPLAYTPVQVVVHGELTEFATNVKRSFDRTFNLAPIDTMLCAAAQAGLPYQIMSEHYTIRAHHDLSLRSAPGSLSIIAPKPVAPAPPVRPAQPEPSEPATVDSSAAKRKLILIDISDDDEDAPSASTSNVPATATRAVRPRLASSRAVSDEHNSRLEEELARLRADFDAFREASNAMPKSVEIGVPVPAPTQESSTKSASTREGKQPAQPAQPAHHSLPPKPIIPSTQNGLGSLPKRPQPLGPKQGSSIRTGREEPVKLPLNPIPTSTSASTSKRSENPSEVNSAGQTVKQAVKKPAAISEPPIAAAPTNQSQKNKQKSAQSATPANPAVEAAPAPQAKKAKHETVMRVVGSNSESYAHTINGLLAPASAGKSGVRRIARQMFDVNKVAGYVAVSSRGEAFLWPRAHRTPVTKIVESIPDIEGHVVHTAAWCNPQFYGVLGIASSQLKPAWSTTDSQVRIIDLKKAKCTVGQNGAPSDVRKIKVLDIPLAPHSGVGVNAIVTLKGSDVDNLLFATGGNDRVIRIWSCRRENGQITLPEVRTVDALHSNFINDIVCPEGTQRLWSVGQDRRVCDIDITKNAIKQEWRETVAITRIYQHAPETALLCLQQNDNQFHMVDFRKPSTAPGLRFGYRAIDDGGLKRFLHGEFSTFNLNQFAFAFEDCVRIWDIRKSDRQVGEIKAENGVIQPHYERASRMVFLERKSFTAVQINNHPFK